MDFKLGEKVSILREGVIEKITQEADGVFLTIRYPNPDPRQFSFGYANVRAELVEKLVSQ